MKKLSLFLVLITLFLITLSGCTVYKDEVLLSLGGHKKIGYYLDGAFQDFTVYAKYKIKAPDFESNSYFKQIDTASQADLTEHIDDFEKWVELSKSDKKSKVAANYDFRKSLITPDDFLYIYDDPDYPPLCGYDVYFFDSETNVLYFFHNNI